MSDLPLLAYAGIDHQRWPLGLAPSRATASGPGEARDSGVGWAPGPVARAPAPGRAGRCASNRCWRSSPRERRFRGNVHAPLPLSSQFYSIMTETQRRQSEAEGIGAIGGHAATLQRLSVAAAPGLGSRGHLAVLPSRRSRSRHAASCPLDRCWSPRAVTAVSWRRGGAANRRDILRVTDRFAAAVADALMGG